MKHKWYDEIYAWARGERLQFRPECECGPWIDWRGSSNDTPQFHLPGYEWRIAPKMRRVTLESGEVVEWPEPMREAPTEGTKYWAACEGYYVKKFLWDTSGHHLARLRDGLCHATREAAEQHAEALRKINGVGDETP